MQDSRRSGLPGCFKYGCFGCLTLIGLSVGLLLLLGALQMALGPREVEMEQAEYSHPLPETNGLLLSESLEARKILPLPDGVQPEVRSGRLELDLSMGNFTIKPGPAGQPMKVEADYDSKSFELKEEFDSSESGDWTYKIRFGSRMGGLGALFGDEGRNRVVITVPRDQPLEIVGEIGVGQSNAQLGGLWIDRVDLDIGIGEHRFDFNERPPFPMESFQLNSSIGELTVHNLGNASPRKVQVNHNIGEVLLNLEGDWQGDVEAEVSINIGECNLRVPDNVRLDLEEARVSLGERQMARRNEEDLPEDAPTLRLRATGRIGEISMR